MINQFVVVDEHAHTYPSEDKAHNILKSFNEFYKIEPTHLGKGTIEEIITTMQRDCIDYTILANFAPSKILHQNNIWTLEMAKEHKQLVPLISIHPHMEGNILNYLRQYNEMGAKGIKIHSTALEFLPNDKKLQSMYEYCNENAIPIVFHCGLISEVKPNNYSDLEMLMPIINKYINIPIILTHMVEGNVKDVLWLSKSFKHVYFDTSIAISGLPYFTRVHDDCWQDDEVVIDIINKVGADRIMFGSDYPFASPIHDINRFINMNITDDEKKLILGENAIRIFDII